ncbi:hypothetical protein PPERSA_09022 [Pseudocohnilembus persalinus]|uniref:CSC1/OSCA1-like cytosolic domain-containing protein n=1 Tax=Pseudocohnilembus persalinus TaxID=266149 RepID=A0A0V0R329_PSEPJ|nr:hypothetical protein PPERSA_09022 [Pseudocohnilembus persalinus]|eukprot:KRX08918.1 hypothetical protein PPERSA_09022 [Pseudocohnilembus persalinus]
MNKSVYSNNKIDSGYSYQQNQYQNLYHKQETPFKLQQAISGYNPIQIPADVQFSMFHGECRNTKDKDRSAQYPTICKCCGFQREQIDISVFDENMKLGFLGSGYPLFYNWVKFSILLLTTSLVISGFNNIKDNLKGDFCENDFPKYDISYSAEEVEKIMQTCYNSFPNLLSIANKINFKQTKIGQESLEFQLGSTQKQLEVVKINLVYNIEYITQLEERLDLAIKNKQEFLKKYHYIEDDPVFTDLEQHIQDIQQRLDKMQESIPQKEEQYFAGIAFISFQTEQMKQDVLRDNQFSKWEKVESYLRGGEKGKINDQDLTWNKTQMIEHTLRKKLEGRFSYIQTALINSYSFLLCLLIVSLNQFWLQKVMQQIVDKESYSTRTRYNIAYATKLSFALFLNSALIYSLSQFLQSNYFGPGGFIYMETWVLIINSVIPPLISFIDPWTILKNKKRKKALAQSQARIRVPDIYGKMQSMNVNKCYLTQDQLNELMEKVEYVQATSYADVLKTMWFTYFFATCLPIGLFLSTISLIFYYWVDKYNLIHKRTIKESISKDVSLEMIELLDLCLLLFGLGNLFFNYLLFDRIGGYILIQIMLSIAYAMTPWKEILKKLASQSIDDLQRYEDIELTHFHNNYDRLNPITKNQALEEHKRKINQLNINRQYENQFQTPRLDK